MYAGSHLGRWIGLAGLTVCAQSVGLDVNSRVWTVGDGLPQGTVNEIVQTDDGELWIATFGGLVRFDGIRFRTVNLAPVPGGNSARITALAAADGNGLWGSTQDGDLLFLRDGELQAWHPIPDGPKEIVDLELAPGCVWTCSSPGELFRFDEGAWTTVLAGAGPATGESLCVDRDGAVWFAAGSTLFRPDPEGSRHTVLHSPNRVLSVAARRAGGVWVGTDGGLARVREGVLEHVLTVPPITEGIVAIMENSQTLWLGTMAGSLPLRSSGEETWESHREPTAPWGQLPVRTLLHDREDNVWIGSLGQGLARISPLHLRLCALTEGAAGPSSLAADPSGGGWVAFGCSGLTHWAGPGQRDDKVQPGPWGCVRALLSTDEGRLWIAGDALFGCRDLGGGSYPVQPFFSGRIGQMAAGPGGTLHVVSTDGELIEIDRDGRVVARLGLDRRVTCLTLDRDGARWLGGSGTIWRVDADGLEAFGPEAGVPAAVVRDLVPDPTGGMWVASYGGGLGWLRAGRMVSITRREGLPDDALTCIQDDGFGRLWISCNRGLMVAERSELLDVAEGRRARVDALLLGTEAGMYEANFGSPAGFKDREGRLWFGTLRGAVVVDPREFPFNATPPTVRVERVIADELELRARGALVEVPPGTRRLSFEYTAFSLTVPERTHFRYRLEGFNDDWSEDDSRRVSYTSLSPGAYKFHVTSRNEHGVWSAAPAVVELRILPEWWQTLWFQAVSALAAAGLLAAVYRARVRILDRRSAARMAAREKQVLAMERESRLRDELAHVTRVATAGELATSLAHEVNQPLTAIASNALAGRRLLDQIGGGEEMSEILSDIERDSRRASEVIKRLRAFLQKEPAERLELDLSRLVRSALPLLRRELEDAGVALSLELEADLPPVAGDAIQLQQVVVNLLKNACEALSSSPQPGRISVRTFAENGWVTLTVTDSGPGLPPGFEQRLFRPFVSGRPGGLGLGLAICATIVEAHGGRISAGNAAGGGAEFAVQLTAHME